MTGLIVAISVGSSLILLSVPASPVVAVVASGLVLPLIAAAVAVQARLAGEGARYRWPWNDPYLWHTRMGDDEADVDPDAQSPERIATDFTPPHV